MTRDHNISSWAVHSFQKIMMKDDISDVDFEYEIEVDEDMNFDEEELEKFNSYSSTEVQFPSDITLDEFDLEEEE